MWPHTVGDHGGPERGAEEWIARAGSACSLGQAANGRQAHVSVVGMHRSRAFVIVSLLAASCSGSSDDASAPPVFLSFGTNVTSATEGDSVVFTAVLTDPDGIDDLIGGSLTSADGTVQYGSFATSGQEGSYSITVTWDALNQVESISFGTMGSRELRAVFFDVAGNMVERTTTLQLTCGGLAACDGECAPGCAAVSDMRIACQEVCATYDGTCIEGGDHNALYEIGAPDPVIVPLDTCAQVPDAERDPGEPFVAVVCECLPPD